MTITEERAAMSAASIDDLPDSDFAWIEPGGSKDAGGKTTPRSLRHFPVHDAAHVRNALARLSSSPFGDRARPRVMAAARKFGIDVAESKAAVPRPGFELLKRRRGSMIRKMERRGALLEMRAKPNGTGGTDFVFEGYGAVFDTPFDMWDPWGEKYTEVVKPGAFTRSLARPDLDVPFLIGHNDAGIPLARTRNGTMRLAEDSRGLHVEARMDGSRSDVRNLASAVERGDMDEMSIGFVTVGQAWDENWEERSMLDLELHRGDVSSVALGANSATAGSRMAEALSRPVPAAAEQRGGNAVDAIGDAADYDPDGPRDGDQQCPACGSVNDAAAKFCDQCGESVVMDLDDVVPDEAPGGLGAALALRRRELEILTLLAG